MRWVKQAWEDLSADKTHNCCNYIFNNVGSSTNDANSLYQELEQCFISSVRSQGAPFSSIEVTDLVSPDGE